MCRVTAEVAEHSDSDTEGSEFVPESDNTDDDNDGGDNSDHSDSNSDDYDDDDDMENLLFELSDVSNFWLPILQICRRISDLAWV